MFAACHLNQDVMIDVSCNNDHISKLDLERDALTFEYQKIWHSIDATQQERFHRI